MVSKRPALFCGGHCCRSTPSQISHAVSLGMFFVHRSCRHVAGIARTVGAAINSKDKRDRSLQHKQPRVKLVRVRSTMHVWFDFALAKLIALAHKVGFKLASIHRNCLSQGVEQFHTPLHNEAN
jgi:hypothetical protein